MQPCGGGNDYDGLSFGVVGDRSSDTANYGVRDDDGDRMDRYSGSGDDDRMNGNNPTISRAEGKRMIGDTIIGDGGSGARFNGDNGRR